jgi:hypothetical protein
MESNELEKRVEHLEAEYRAGERMLAELDAKRADLRETMLRISGAIQVLRELLAAPPEPGQVEEPEPSLLAG